MIFIFVNTTYICNNQTKKGWMNWNDSSIWANNDHHGVPESNDTVVNLNITIRALIVQNTSTLLVNGNITSILGLHNSGKIIINQTGQFISKGSFHNDGDISYYGHAWITVGYHNNYWNVGKIKIADGAILNLNINDTNLLQNKRNLFNIGKIIMFNGSINSTHILFLSNESQIYIYGNCSIIPGLSILNASVNIYKMSNLFMESYLHNGGFLFIVPNSTLISANKITIKTVILFSLIEDIGNHIINETFLMAKDKFNCNFTNIDSNGVYYNKQYNITVYNNSKSSYVIINNKIHQVSLIIALLIIATLLFVVLSSVVYNCYKRSKPQKKNSHGSMRIMQMI